MIEIVSAISLWELVKHAGTWVNNLKRAKTARKQASVTALRKVIVAARRTAVYVRQLKSTGKQSHKIETELAILWTELSFDLTDLGMTKLAKRCQIKGKQWADPSKMDAAFLEKADVGLEKMERLANVILYEIEH